MKRAHLTPQIIAAGGDHSLAVTGDGKAYTWGDNDNGQLGNNSKDDSSTPVVLNLSDMSAIAAGLNHSLALKNNGTVWAWGRNYSGQLGDGTKEERCLPIEIANLTHIQAIAAGKQHSLALKDDGTVWVWEVTDGVSLEMANVI
ncbi:MAG: hypothetical protein GY749_06350 [Desulfobacteraceae bacterium]|nr:hypothetical protein [Desulfobacteraceae bacterium]